MRSRIVTRSVLLLLATMVIAVSLQRSEVEEKKKVDQSDRNQINTINNNQLKNNRRSNVQSYNQRNINQRNQKRAIYSNGVKNYNVRVQVPKKPGFFKTLFQVIYEQWADTKETYRNVTKLLDNGFLPENAPPPTPTPPFNPNVSTTAAPFKLKRSELIALLRKNFLGIGRLVDIEVKQALESSDKTWPQYKTNFTKEVSKFL